MNEPVSPQVLTCTPGDSAVITVQIQVARPALPEIQPVEDPKPTAPSDVEVVSEFGSDVFIEAAKSEVEDGTGAGTRGRPYRLRFVDEMFRRHRGMPRVFRFGDGEYRTRGTWAHVDNGWGTADFGQILEGTQVDRTHLIVSDPVLESNGSPRAYKDTYIFWGGHWQEAAWKKAPEIRRMTLRAEVPPGVLVGGVVLHGTNPVWEDINIEDIRGRWPSGDDVHGKEHFAILCKNGKGGAKGRRYRIRAFPGSYVGAVYVGYTNPDTFSDVEMGDIDLGYDNQFILAACRMVRFRAINGRGARNFIYNDTDVTDRVTLTESEGECEYAAIHHVVQHPEQFKRGVRAWGNRFRFIETQKPNPWIAVATTVLQSTTGLDGAPLRKIAGGPPLPNTEPNDGFVMTDNEFVAPGARQFYAVSADAWRFNGLFQLNRLPARSIANLLHGARARFTGNTDSETQSQVVAPQGGV